MKVHITVIFQKEKFVAISHSVWKLHIFFLSSTLAHSQHVQWTGRTSGLWGSHRVSARGGAVCPSVDPFAWAPYSDPWAAPDSVSGVSHPSETHWAPMCPEPCASSLTPLYSPHSHAFFFLPWFWDVSKQEKTKQNGSFLHLAYWMQHSIRRSR